MDKRFSRALWRIYNRPNSLLPFSYGGNLPWDDAAFSRRMLAYHLDETDAAASRVSAERTKQLKWMTEKLGLAADQQLFDIACGPGLYAVALADMGVSVLGVDFGPAAIDYANSLAQTNGVAGRCDFRLADMLEFRPPQNHFQNAILLYGQLAVMAREDAAALLKRVCGSLVDGGCLLLEMLDQRKVDKSNSTWWFSDDSGLWGDAPFLHLGERIWHPDEQISTERYHILHLDSAELEEIILNDQTYSVAAMTQLLRDAGFASVDVYPAWDNIGLYDEDEWVVYIAQKG